MADEKELARYICCQVIHRFRTTIHLFPWPNRQFPASETKTAGPKHKDVASLRAWIAAASSQALRLCTQEKSRVFRDVILEVELVKFVVAARTGKKISTGDEEEDLGRESPGLRRVCDARFVYVYR